MDFLAFPLRIEGSVLARCDEGEAVLQLVKIMAATPNGSWSGCRHFGVRDLFEQARGQRNLMDRATREINAALEDLGVRRFRVESSAAENEAQEETQAYVLTLVSTDSPGQILRIDL